MTWTAPRTWTTGETVTAAIMNTHVRDNLLETAAATATAAGDLVYADASKSMGSRVAHPGTSRMLISGPSNTLVWRQPQEDINYSDGAASSIETATSYTSVWGVGNGPNPVSLPRLDDLATGTLAVVIASCFAASNSTGGATTMISIQVAGDTTLGVGDGTGGLYESGGAGDRGAITVVRVLPLNAGSNDFIMNARVSSGAGTIERPRIAVIPL